MLSLSSCSRVVDSLQCYQVIQSILIIPLSKASFEISQAFLISPTTSQQKTEQFRANPNLVGSVVARELLALSEAFSQHYLAAAMYSSLTFPCVHSQRYLRQSAFSFKKKMVGSLSSVAGSIMLSRSSIISLPYLINCSQILLWYSFIWIRFLESEFLIYSFFSADFRDLQAVLREETPLLYAMERRLRSQTLRTGFCWTISLITSIISSQLFTCSNTLA